MEETQEFFDENQSNALAALAFKKIKALCAGNGLKKSEVKFGRFEGSIIQFAARIVFEIKPALSEKIVPGKQNGEVVGSRQDALLRVDKYIKGAQHEKDVHAGLSKAMLTRKDKGFGIKPGMIVRMDAFHRDYVWYSGCQQCGTRGQSQCPQCHGNREEQCIRCHGSTRVHCQYCGGSGQQRTSSGSESCRHCQGRGQAPCDFCRQSGKTPCKTCAARGTMSCKPCSGTGWFTNIAHAELSAKCHFDFSHETVPGEVAAILEKNPAMLIEKNHIRAQPAQELEVKESNVLLLHYLCDFPYGPADFVIKEKPIKASIFGYQAMLMNVPDFLEGLLRPAFRDLERAAKGEGSVPGLLKKAGKYRFMAFALLNAARFSPKKTYKMVKAKYPFGVTDSFIENVSVLGDAATRLITRRVRYIGLAVGLAAAGAIDAVYLLGGVRNMLLGGVANTALHPVADLFVLVMGAALTTFAAQIAAKNAMNTALGHLLPPEKRGALRGKIGNAAYIGWGAAVLVFLAMLELTGHMPSVSTPDWYASFRGL